MIYKIRHIIAIIIATIALSSCSEYQMLLKQHDNELWYKKALEYYAQQDYAKAANLFGGILTAYTGTSRADTITLAYANCLTKIGDYYSAAQYYQTYVKTFPSSENCEECQYMSGYCYYMLSPKFELDQADSQECINELQTFMNLYPNSNKIGEATRMMKEMEDKIAYKAYKSAKLYFDLGNYMGNNYKSAVIVAQNCLRKYPDTKHREELSFLILEAKFIQAESSVIQKQCERYRDTIDEYYTFVNEYPQSQYSRRANSILEASEKGLKAAEKIAPLSEDDLDYYRNYGNEIDRKRLFEAEHKNEFND
ncbi:MAG: outer membrane protein assembly factor BamD [Bacteroidales bacterium]|nr:outer membrane protein assembly factor BamD [Bacteroidales bacterium]